MSAPRPLLVTGALGFIGRRLCATLRGEGHRVRAVVRTAGSAPAGCEEVVADLTRMEDLTRLTQGVDTVFHLAARAHVTHETAADPWAEYLRINRDATVRLAQSAAAQQVRRFVFLSSIGVLGERTGGAPFDHRSPAAPVALYAKSKHEAEQVISDRAWGMEVVIVRPPLVHGPGARGNMERLLRLAAGGMPLPLAGIANRRTFVGIENLVSGLLLAMDHPRASEAPLLLADRESASTADLIRMMRAGLGRPARLFTLPGISAARHLPVVGSAFEKLTSSLEVDGSETRARLGWMPPRSLEEGIHAMVRTARTA